MHQLITTGDMPVSVVALRDHCRVNGDDYDSQLTRAWFAAAHDIERRTGLLLRPCTVRVSRKGGSGLHGLILPVGPVDLSTVVINDSDGVGITEGWELDPNAGEPTLCVTDRTRFSPEAIFDVEFSAGLASLPADLNVALLALAAHHFENREATTDRPLYAVPSSVWSIVANYGRAKT